MKIETFLQKSFESFFGGKSLTVLLLGLILNTPLFSQLPSAQQIAGHMKAGWNMGNTLEATGGETAWGGAYTTQKLIDSVRAAGFDAVRLPCAWFSHSDTVTDVIDSSWLARVKQVVGYCIHDSLYVIVNIHWDSGWLENRVTAADSAIVNKRQHDYWTQIADYLKDSDEHLLFASANEPNVTDAKGMSILLSYHQTFINAVRAAGGNNSSRTLIIQGPSTDIEETNSLMNTLPTDQIANRMIVEVHYYTPWNFCGLTQDESWGKMFYYWGKNYHSATDLTRNATWGEEDYLDNEFAKMKTKFVDNGIPVIIGEFSAFKRTLSQPSDQALNHACVEHFDGYVARSAINHGMVPFYWDTNMGLFNRSTGIVLDHGILDSIMVGSGILTDIRAETDLTSPNEFHLEQNYPNPFNPSTVISYQIPMASHVTLKVYDVLGREVRTLLKAQKQPGKYQIKFDGTNLPSGVYFYRLQTGNFGETKKLLLLK